MLLLQKSKVRLLGKGRADLVALHSSGISYCFEVLNTESLGEFYKKHYPIDAVPVIAKEFDYNTFRI